MADIYLAITAGATCTFAQPDALKVSAHEDKYCLPVTGSLLKAHVYTVPCKLHTYFHSTHVAHILSFNTCDRLHKKSQIIVDFAFIDLSTSLLQIWDV